MKRKRKSKRNTGKALGKARIREITRIAKSVRERILDIAYFAQAGDKLAALELYKIALAGTTWLNLLALKRPDRFSPIAASKMVWPGLWNAHPEINEDSEALARGLNLGSGFGINFSQAGKIFSLDVPANEVAMHLLCLAQALRRAPIDIWDSFDRTLLPPIEDSSRFDRVLLPKGARRKRGGAGHDPQQFRKLEAWGRRVDKSLPTLSRATIREWKSPMRELFRIVYGERFDQHRALQKLKKSVIGHAKDCYSGKRGPGVVRQAMLRKVLQALNSIAPLD